jgi:TPR repeat protein
MTVGGSPEEKAAHFQKAQALRDAGEVDAAMALFEEMGPHGYTELAWIEAERGNDDLAAAWMAKAEAHAKAGDAMTNFLCHLAYRWRRVPHRHGDDYDDAEQERLDSKARHFLRRAAELGDVGAQMTLAQYLRSNSNGFAKDRAASEYWMARAVAEGGDNMFLIQVETRFRDQRPVDPAWIPRLEELAAWRPPADAASDVVQLSIKARRLLDAVRSGEWEEFADVYAVAASSLAEAKGIVEAALALTMETVESPYHRGPYFSRRTHDERLDLVHNIDPERDEPANPDYDASFVLYVTVYKNIRQRSEELKALAAQTGGKLLFLDRIDETVM